MGLERWLWLGAFDALLADLGLNPITSMEDHNHL